MIVRELTDVELWRAHAAMVALRPHHDDRDAFVARVLAQRSEGYRLLAAFLDEQQQEAVGALGFRPFSTLWAGDALYVDDLSVLPSARRRGVATALLDAVTAIAQDLGRVQVHLDSGHQRHDAHKLYLGHGFSITSHHFAISVEPA